MLNKQLRPDYAKFVKDMKGCNGELLHHVVQDKIEQLCCSLESSTKNEAYFKHQLEVLKSKETKTPSPMLSIDIPLPKTERLVHRQIQFVEESIESLRAKRGPTEENLKSALRIADNHLKRSIRADIHARAKSLVTH